MKLNKAKGTTSPELVQRFSLLESRVFERTKGKSPFDVVEADLGSIDDSSPNVDEFSVSEAHVRKISNGSGSTMAVYNSLQINNPYDSTNKV